MINLITTNERLHEFCQKLEQQDFITVDLEFHREKTYYAKLGLIQVGAKGFEAIIDPLSKELDLTEFYNILDNPKIVKVFHSCRQDIEILYRMSGLIPHPLFDTQVAAQLCGFGTTASYESLVNTKTTGLRNIRRNASGLYIRVHKRKNHRIKPRTLVG